MFQQRQTRNLAQAAFTTVALIYHMTVYSLRKTDRNAVVGLVMAIAQSLVMVAVFYLMFYVLGVRQSPIRGNMILYIMSGIFMFMTHIKSVGAVAGGGNALSPLLKHAPLNTAITIVAKALATLYQQVLAAAVILFIVDTLLEPMEIENIYACLGMLILAWFSGCCVGMVFVAAGPWWPEGAKVARLLYMRANMIASGKMFVANTMPPFMLQLFDWNPLFHIIDQTRGFAFINYSPRNSDLMYPIYVSLALLMIGLMGEFVTRRSVSLSWSAGR